jgi:hypothetical protein
MSPRHSDYRSEEFYFEDANEIICRREFGSFGGPVAPRPVNRPARTGQAPPRRKSSRTVAVNGMQRRRNKHWSW